MVIERFLEQLPSLQAFFQGAVMRRNNPHAVSIRDTLNDPMTICDLQFLSNALRSMAAFEKAFPTVSICLLHGTDIPLERIFLYIQGQSHMETVWEGMVDLYEKWLLSFVRPAALAKPIWKTDVIHPQNIVPEKNSTSV